MTEDTKHSQKAEPPGAVVAVRALCDFAARRGDLDHRFTPSPSSNEGIAGHRTVAARRGSGYRAEVSLSGAYRHLVVRGRADGYDAARGLLEEIKTFRGDLARMPANQRALHWAQAKVYGWLVCERHGLAHLDVALVYFDVDRQQEAPPLMERCTAEALRLHFEALCASFIDWADQEHDHRARRDAALTMLRFPHEAFRSGQRELAAGVYRAVRTSRCLLAQAPTGIGKTVGTVYPMLKAAATQGLDRIFYLTAKGSGRALAFDAIATVRSANPATPLRVVELIARDKACEHPDRRCHGDSCPLARGFYDRLPAARSAAIHEVTLTRDTLRDVARAHAVCPYYLGQELARWCDVVVGDYNHYFDQSAALFALGEQFGWRTGVLVDEAHNLLDRARDMYSGTLRADTLVALRRATAGGPLGQSLERLQRTWDRLVDAQAEPWAACERLPQPVVAALQEVTRAMSIELADEPSQASDLFLRFYFDMLQFMRLCESFAQHSMFVIERGDANGSTLAIRNVVPAPFLKPRFAATRTTVLFSATLTPHAFYADTLGLPADVARIDVAAPFHHGQLAVRIVRDVSTRFHHRERSLAPIAALMARQHAARPGNYLAFFSSYDYLEQAASLFAERHPGITQWRQERAMRDDERAAFLRRFEPGGQGIGFAVLGGAFAEGIDLPGTRLIGAFIATLGLPQLSPFNEEMRRRHDAYFDAGYEYTYLFPGIRKVTQAAGRVIRSLDDRGTVHLIDDRFARAEVLDLLPAWWRIEGRSDYRARDFVEPSSIQTGA